ncbi:Flagellin FlgL [Bradyrhizobium sp. NFR13]|jgi:flagellin-like hook-associated protein FlgL|nr:Flagellin FlgL [Bradyrhizobium sp. NFR13]
MRGEQEGTNMSVVLSASVRQNLLSLQSTADLLSTTQNRLASGKKVNTALDNPTNFFTAAGLDSRASDINNLLDGIGNGVQILQAANTGITSLQKLVDTAKSLANQALQTPVGYSTKSNVSTTIAGATPDDLRGTQTFASATATSNAVYNGTAGGTTPVTGATTLGGVAASLVGTAAPDGAGTAASLSGTLKLIGTPAGATTIGAAAQPNDGDTMMVNGKTITFRTGPAPTAATAPVGLGVAGNVVTDGNGNSTVYLGTAGAPTGSVADLTTAIDLASGVQKAVIANGAATISHSSGTDAAIAAGVLTLSTSTGSDLNISGKADLLKQLGLTTSVGAGTVSVSQSRTTAPGTIGNLIQSGSTLYVNGKTITFKDASVPAAANIPVGSGSPVGSNLVTDGSGNTTVYLQGGKISDVLTAIDLATGVQTAANNATTGVATLTTTQGSTASTVAANGTFKISTGTIQDLSISGSGNALSALGLAGNTGTSTVFTAARAAGPGGISGTTLTFSSFKGGTPVNITFGDGTNGTVKTLAQLNVALAANNLAATVDATGKLVISSGNDYASSTMGSVLDGGTIGGTVTSALSFTSAAPPVVDLPSQSTRANLVAQYNNVITQITTTSQDASFNGVNLLAGDTLKLVFNETGKSTLNITGSQLTPAGLGLPTLVSGSDFIDNASTNKTLTQLNMASTQLRSLASSLGSNLSIVQIRQDFAKNLINTLQTGSSNLTLADTNEEAANSQALSTRQSIAVSALALANQSQQSVLKLLQ